MKTHRCTLLLLVWLSAVAARGGDWPQWRGPDHDGSAADEDLADTWPASGPPVLWARELGQGYSAFAVVDDRAYTQTQSLYEQTVICLDANTGATLWEHRCGWPYDGGGLYPGPRATPTVVDGRVYFAAPNGLLGCLDAESGSAIWSVNLKEHYAGRGTDFGVAASPVVWQDKVIVPVGGRDASLVAVDAGTGRLVWKCGQLPASYATPLLARLGDRTLVLAPLENSLLCADADTGQQLWELPLSSGYDEHSAALLYREPFLVSAGPFRAGAKCYRLVSTDDSGGCRADLVWESAQFSNDVASSNLIDDCIYGFDLRDAQSRVQRPSRGTFRCLNLADGSMRWSSSEPGQANVIAAGDKLLLFNDRGELRLCRASPDRYEELARARVFSDEICWTPPALSNGRVFLRTQSRAVCLFVGRTAQSGNRPAQSLASIPQARRVDVAAWLGGEREFPAATPELTELQRWYAWTAGALAAAGFGALAVSAAVGRLRRRRTPADAGALAEPNRNSAGAWAYWPTVFACGTLGSALLNPHQTELLFTWPLALWCLMQLAVETAVAAVRQRGRSATWRARGMMLLFMAGCGIYFHVCRRLGLAPEWSFLAGFVAAAPLAMLMAWRSRREKLCAAIRVPMHLASYTVYFWGSVLFMNWRMPVGS